MLRAVLRYALPLIAVFTALILASHTLGTNQIPNPALAGFTEDCEGITQPCWYGIVPGVTTLREVGQRLGNFGYRLGLGTTDRSLSYVSDKWSPGCVEVNFDVNTALVSWVSLGCADIRTGDVTLLLGEPDYRVWHTKLDSDWIYQNVSVRLWQVWSASPFETIQYLDLLGSVKSSSGNDSIMPWQGFLPRWRYCQLEPDYKGCRS